MRDEPTTHDKESTNTNHAYPTVSEIRVPRPKNYLPEIALVTLISGECNAGVTPQTVL